MKLSGSLPNEIGALGALMSLGLIAPLISGTLPDSIGILERLTDLTVSGVSIVGIYLPAKISGAWGKAVCIVQRVQADDRLQYDSNPLHLTDVLYSPRHNPLHYKGIGQPQRIII